MWSALPGAPAEQEESQPDSRLRQQVGSLSSQRQGENQA